MKRPNFQLTPHFSYYEMTRSAWAEAHNVDNTPDCLQIAALTNLSRKILEPLREKFGPISINSAFRSETVNYGVHGVGNSKHLTGEAADIYLPDEETGRAYFRFLKTLPDIDQMLFEYRNWVSFNLNSPQLSDVKNLLSNMPWSDNDVLTDMTSDTLLIYKGGQWLGSGSTTNMVISPKKAYAIKANESCVFPIGGTIVKEASDRTINLKPGWNAIGYTPIANPLNGHSEMQKKQLFLLHFAYLFVPLQHTFRICRKQTDRRMKIVVDDKIPYIHEKLALLADEVVYLSGAAITADDVRDADALIVRTRTRCDEQLLKGSRVQFVATATIGFDHIDTDYMQRAGIAWTNCPGCNSGSVAQYVECALLLLQQQRGLCLQTSTIGIVGCGHVGSKVKTVAERLGMRILVCDPPLAEASSDSEGKDAFVTLDVLEREADVITFHVPLTTEGPYATYHLADEAFFRRLTRVPYIINSSRGEVVDGDALLEALTVGSVRDAVIDVWEHEPQLNLSLLQRVFIGTPHIAGYSADGKVNADNMVIDALCRHFHLPHPGKITAPQLPEDFPYTGNPLELYNPLDDSEKLKQKPEDFEKWRNQYPLRREHFDKFKCQNDIN